MFLEIDDKKSSKLINFLLCISLIGWNKTKMLLSSDINGYCIDHKLIKTWEMASECLGIYLDTLDIRRQQTSLPQLSLVMELTQTGKLFYKKALEIYIEIFASGRLSAFISPHLGKLLQKYTKEESRLIAFIIMRFYHTNYDSLLQIIYTLGQTVMPGAGGNRVTDEDVYLPLQQANNAANQQNLDFPALPAVQTVSHRITKIGKQIYKRVIEFYSFYDCHTASLGKSMVKTSTIWDRNFSSISMVVDFIYKFQSYSRRIISPVRDVLFHIKPSVVISRLNFAST